MTKENEMTRRDMLKDKLVTNMLGDIKSGERIKDIVNENIDAMEQARGENVKD